MNLKIPDIASGKSIPPGIEYQILKEEQLAEEREADRARETKRFIITTVIASIAALASVVAAVASILAYLT